MSPAPEAAAIQAENFQGGATTKNGKPLQGNELTSHGDRRK